MLVAAGIQYRLNSTGAALVGVRCLADAVDDRQIGVLSTALVSINSRLTIRQGAVFADSSLIYSYYF